ncbi:hypothetical protein SEVIR_3G278801v4 [Setaria viridis]
MDEPLCRNVCTYKGHMVVKGLDHRTAGSAGNAMPTRGRVAGREDNDEITEGTSSGFARIRSMAHERGVQTTKDREEMVGFPLSPFSGVVDGHDERQRWRLTTAATRRQRWRLTTAATRRQQSACTCCREEAPLFYVGNQQGRILGACDARS